MQKKRKYEAWNELRGWRTRSKRVLHGKRHVSMVSVHKSKKQRPKVIWKITLKAVDDGHGDPD